MLPRRSILKVKPYVPGSPVEEIKRRLRIEKVVKLASNENALGPSKKAVEAIKEAAGQINRYPDGDCFYLKKKLARRLKLDSENLIFGCGSDEIIVLAIRAFVNETDEVVVARPTFLIYELAARIAGARVKPIPLRDFRYDLLKMRKAITSKTKIVFIANPDNPTGTYVNRKELAGFMEGLPRDLIVYIDEAYYELVDKKDFPDSLKYLDSHNVIIGRTFSKAYGLSGLRIGYGISRPKIINYMNRVREPFNVNSLAQAAAFAALDDSAHLLRTRRMLKEGKNYLYRNFKRLNFSFVESVTNFVLVKTGPRTPYICQQLLKKGIIVRNMQTWGMNNFIRVTIGTMAENRRFIKALEKVLKQL